tara:strand:+ start:42 stop:347 length:306 start_codon:yes stop_codon:yes gene_type:complete
MIKKSRFLKLYKLQKTLKIMENPIKDNRLVVGIHFAIRFLSFAEAMDSGCACGEDEKESMISYASKLLEHQIQTATSEHELTYLDITDAKIRLEKAKQFLR